METVVIVIHLMVIVSLIAIVLLQRSEGGALGIGGGGNFMGSRGQGSVLTKATTILGIAFFATSLAMSVLARMNAPPSAILDAATQRDGAITAAGDATDSGGGGILDQLEAFTGETVGGPPQVPVSE
ncbi:MAG: preprotein translocase subunit SecG [Alphaproteobacteria bacterium]